MSKVLAFIQVHGQSGTLEVELTAGATVGQLHDALAAVGVTLDAETAIFIDEADEHISCERHERIPGLKHGCRIHISRWKRISTTVHYLEKTAEREFPPGARVRAVKAWAVRRFELDPKDAAEHVLQLCSSTERPSSDTPLHQLVTATDGDCGHGHGHGLCFDLVPDKRVEG